ncbi:MAG TPA: hypothetical protein VJT31_02145 [Rugosimonospora sp.]|nr:hypothetical protein [Rugosimonospora sp.]
MQIAWHSLGQVLGVGLLVGAGAVIVFTLGVLGLNRVAVAREDGRGDALGAGIAGVCFLACAAIVVYGIYLVVPQFH